MDWEIPESNDDPDLTPMIDIVFLLIVFFMTVANVISSENVPIKIPVADQSIVPESREGRLIFTITADGKFFKGSAPVELEEITTLVAASVQSDPNLPILLRIDALTPYEFTQQMMSACSEGGGYNLIFTNQQDPT